MNNGAEEVLGRKHMIAALIKLRKNGEITQSDLYRNAPFKVVVCHMPPFGGWHGELDILKKFIPVLNQAKPDVYLTAHLHQYIRNEAGKDGVAFPLIVNSNNTLLKADADAGKLDIRIYDLDGKMIDQLVIKK